MKPFIRAAEIWVPTADKSRLVFADGFYGPLTAFRVEHITAFFSIP